MRSASSVGAKPHRIIIADDESLIRLDLREMLTHLGYDVIAEAGDGRSALELARKLQPDLMIMDIKMPDLDGIAAAEELTREQIAPVVLLTAYSDQALVERAKEAGVVGYVVKSTTGAICSRASTSSAPWSASSVTSRKPSRRASRSSGPRAC
jgi:response regulator NasT